MINRRPGQRGAALIIVLVMVATLSVVAVGLTEVMGRATQRTFAAQARDGAVWALIGAERAARLALEKQAEVRPDVDLLSESWLASPQVFEFDGVLIEARFEDRSACFNVNDLVDKDDANGLVADPAAIERFAKLVEAAGGDRRGGEALGAAIADFIDADGTALLGGGEDGAYSRRDMPYRTASTFLAEVSELRAIRGWSRTAYRALAPYLCARYRSANPSPLNINTLRPADAPLLAAALDHRVDERTLERLIEDRPPDGYETVQAFLGVPAIASLSPPLPEEISARFATGASYIEFYARVVYDPLVFELTSTIEAEGGGTYRVTSRRFGSADL